MRFAPLLQNRRVRQALTLLLIAGALACMFPPQNALFQWWSAHSVWVSGAYLMAAMVLLVLSRTRLMFVCLGCSAAVSFYATEMELRRREPHAEDQPALKFVCLHQPVAQAQEVVGILLERGMDAVVLAHPPNQADSALLSTLLRHWPNHFEAPGNPSDTLCLSLYTRLPLNSEDDSIIVDSSGGFWMCLRPEFSREKLWVYVAGEVRNGESEDRSAKSEVESGVPETKTSDTVSSMPDFARRTSHFALNTPSGPVVAIGHQYNTAMLVRAGIAGWQDSYLCQKNDEKGLKYPYQFRIYHTPDIDCVQSQMLRLANQGYLGLESILRLSHESKKPL